jgi:hypothetical protein
MKRIVILVMSLLVMSVALPGWSAGAASNPWIYENGKSRFHYARYDDGFDRYSVRKGHRVWASNRRGHWPPPGKCQAWFLSRVPGC